MRTPPLHHLPLSATWRQEDDEGEEDDEMEQDEDALLGGDSNDGSSDDCFQQV